MNEISKTKTSAIDPDEIYSELLSLHENLSDQESAELDARLILLLINEIDDYQKLKLIFEQAKVPLNATK